MLGPALRGYSRKSLPLNIRLDYLLKDFDYKIGCVSGPDVIILIQNMLVLYYVTTLKNLNPEFDVPTGKKPRPDYIASTLVAEITINNVSSRNGPRMVQNQISLQAGWNKNSTVS